MLFGLTLDALILVALAALLMGIAKAGFGGGVGVIGTPLVALAMPVSEAAALLLPVLIGTDFFTVGHFRRSASGRDLSLLLPASLVGVAAAALAFDALSDHDRALKAGVGALALAFVTWRLIAPRLTGRLQQAAPPSPALGGLMGALAGFGSTLAHAGGPPLTVYLLPRRLPRHVFVGTTAWFFFALNLVKLVPYAWLGLLSAQRLALALMLLPLAGLGTWLGVRLLRGFDERLFTRFVTVLLTLAGVQLLLGRGLMTYFR
ncbi:MAG: sulfite exporter TauE/SafE family protein [Trueperaceae bacterium]